MLVCVLGKLDPVREEPFYPIEFPQYLRCYRCLLETKELGCLLGSDICLTSAGSSCITLFIKNSKVPSVCPGPRTESLHFLSPNSQMLSHHCLPFLQSHSVSSTPAWLSAHSCLASALRRRQLAGTLEIPSSSGLSSGCLLPSQR